MNRKFIAIAFAGLSAIFASNTFAQTKQTCPVAPENCTAAATCSPKAGHHARNCFDGLDLTADQKTRLEQVNKECREQCTQNNKKAHADRRENMTRFRTERLAKIKEILTPEQYVKFLENNFVNGNGKMARNGKMAHNGKKARNGRNGQCAGNAQACTKAQPACNATAK